MRYVLDSNVALKWVLAEADSGKAVPLRDPLLRRPSQPQQHAQGLFHFRQGRGRNGPPRGLA